MRRLKALKVKIGLKTDGGALYPDFNSLEVIKQAKVDWSKYVDSMGDGWHYDKTSGHKEASDDSPMGMQWGVLLVSNTFATQAAEMFPEECTIIDEAEYTDFHENKAHKHEPEELADSKVLEVIKAKRDASVKLSLKDEEALDPENDTPGIRKNKRKLFADYKQLKGIELI